MAGPLHAEGCAISGLTAKSEAAGLNLDWEAGSKEKKGLRQSLKQCLQGKLMSSIAGVTGVCHVFLGGRVFLGGLCSMQAVAAPACAQCVEGTFMHLYGACCSGPSY